MDGPVSDSTSSASDGSTKELVLGGASPSRLAKRNPAPTKKRKTTYNVRKDEIQSLEDQAQSLEARLQQYECEMPFNKSGLRDALIANAVLAHAVEQSTFSLARTRSMMSAHTLAMIRATGVVPLKDYIHLPADPNRRTAVLSGLHEPKLHSAIQFMAERTRWLDLSIAHKQSEQFVLPDGELGVVSLDVTPFTQGHSVRQVYDALVSFIVNQEITVSEKFGILTIRESEEIDEFKFAQSRLLSTVPGGIEVETNIITFASCVDATPETPGFAVGAMDFVDVDDLHPYRRDTCVRKEVTGAFTFHEIPSLTDGKPTVVMTRWSYLRVPPPPYAISEEAASIARNAIAQWCDVIPKIMKEQLVFTTPAP